MDATHPRQTSHISSSTMRSGIHGLQICPLIETKREPIPEDQNQIGPNQITTQTRDHLSHMYSPLPAYTTSQKNPYSVIGDYEPYGMRTAVPVQSSQPKHSQQFQSYSTCQPSVLPTSQPEALSHGLVDQHDTNHAFRNTMASSAGTSGYLPHCPPYSLYFPLHSHTTPYGDQQIETRDVQYQPLESQEMMQWPRYPGFSIAGTQHGLPIPFASTNSAGAVTLREQRAYEPPSIWNQAVSTPAKKSSTRVKFEVPFHQMGIAPAPSSRWTPRQSCNHRVDKRRLKHSRRGAPLCGNQNPATMSQPGARYTHCNNCGFGHWACEDAKYQSVSAGISIAVPKAMRVCKSNGSTYFGEAQMEDWDEQAEDISADILQEWIYDWQHEESDEAIALRDALRSREISAEIGSEPEEDPHAGYIGRMKN
jgi:hypothetical protein